MCIKNQKEMQMINSYCEKGLDTRPLIKNMPNKKATNESN